jgi:hypothetical protein
MTHRFADRLEPATFSDDPPIGAGASDDYTDWVYLPERLFYRMLDLGRAYDLHILPSLHLYDRNELDRDRTASLIEELEFLADVVNDRALTGAITVLRDAASRAARSPLDSTRFFIEGP